MTSVVFVGFGEDKSMTGEHSPFNLQLHAKRAAERQSREQQMDRRVTKG